MVLWSIVTAQFALWQELIGLIAEKMLGMDKVSPEPNMLAKS